MSQKYTRRYTVFQSGRMEEVWEGGRNATNERKKRRTGERRRKGWIWMRNRSSGERDGQDGREMDY